ncbi:MAG: hypothetical protein ACRC33_00530 [Gemmataceae bacterium]
MSSDVPTPGETPRTSSDRPEQVVIISHTPFFYWWPVWAVGFVMAGLSYFEGQQTAFVPPGTVAKRAARIEGIDGPRDALVAPEGRPLPAEADDDVLQPHLRMTVSNNPGMIWTVTLCLLIVITHVQLRGMWSVIAILMVVLVTVVFAYFGLWDGILRSFRGIDIHISAAGYLAISGFLFVIWLLTFLLYDRREYMIFTRGQLRVRKAVGTGEVVYDTRGMVVKKHRDALFRHWLLGFGSGDLTIQTSGTNSAQFEMPNVLFIDRKLALINTMLQEREVFKAR